MSDARRRFRWLVKLLPPSFREEYETEILRTWHAEAREAEPERDGRPGSPERDGGAHTRRHSARGWPGAR